MALSREIDQGQPREPRPAIYRSPLPFKRMEVPKVQEALPTNGEMVAAIGTFAEQTLRNAEMVRLERKLSKIHVVALKPAEVATIEIMENDREQDLPSLADASFLIKYDPNDTTTTGLRRSIIGFIKNEETGEFTTRAFRIKSELEVKFSLEAPTDITATDEELSAIWNITQDPQIIRETPRSMKTILPYASRPISHAPRRGSRDFSLINLLIK